MSERIKFWQLLLDDRMSAWEANAINAAHDSAGIASSQAMAAQASIERTNHRLNDLSREIVMLRTAVTVLTKTLLDCEVINQRLLEARLEAAMEEAFAPPPPPPAAEAMTSPNPSLTCVRCRIAKPANQTTMTDDGPVCDACISK